MLCDYRLDDGVYDITALTAAEDRSVCDAFRKVRASHTLRRMMRLYCIGLMRNDHIAAFMALLPAGLSA